MSRELFSRDPMTGMTVWFDYNELTDEVTLEYEQDVEPILETNKAMQNSSEYTSAGIKSDMWHYAQIPIGVQMKWLIEDGIDIYDDNAWPQIYRKLNDPEYRYLKTTAKYHGLPKTNKGLIVP